MNTLKYLTLVLFVLLSNKSIANGADVYKDNYSYNPCFEGSYTDNNGNFIEFTYCYENNGTWHQVITPSGNVIYKFKGSYRWTDTYTINGVTYYNYSDLIERKYNYLIKDGEQHVVKDRASEVLNYEDLNYCVVYSWNYEYQFVNGDVIKNDIDFIAEPCN